jgi:hypothetical protein
MNYVVLQTSPLPLGYRALAITYRQTQQKSTCHAPSDSHAASGNPAIFIFVHVSRFRNEQGEYACANRR